MITKEQAVELGGKHRAQLQTIHMRTAAGLPYYCRVNGKCKTWKTRPEDFRLPVKYGLYECFYITPVNASDWEVA